MSLKHNIEAKQDELLRARAIVDKRDDCERKSNLLTEIDRQLLVLDRMYQQACTFGAITL